MATNVSAPLPDLDLEASSIITVDAGDAAAVITRMVVHFTQNAPELPTKLEPFTPLFVYATPSET
jgi:hypothetical protein